MRPCRVKTTKTITRKRKQENSDNKNTNSSACNIDKQEVHTDWVHNYINLIIIIMRLKFYSLSIGTARFTFSNNQFGLHAIYITGEIIFYTNG